MKRERRLTTVELQLCDSSSFIHSQLLHFKRSSPSTQIRRSLRGHRKSRGTWVVGHSWKSDSRNSSLFVSDRVTLDELPRLVRRLVHIQYTRKSKLRSSARH